MKRAFAFVVAASALRAVAAPPTAEIGALRERAEAAQLRMTQDLVAPPMPRAGEEPARASEAIWASALRAAVLAEVRGWSAQVLLDADSPAALLGHAAQVWTLGEGLQAQARDVDAVLPAWLQEAIRQRVSELAMPARAAAAASAEGGWIASTPYEPDRVDWRRPAVWSGPAVRDRAASYRSEGGTTRIRVAVGSASLLWRLALARGAGVRMTLDDAGRELRWTGRLPLRLELRLPVWLATPQGLVAATLTGARADGPCDGGGWTALQVAGNQQPAVWAILFLPDEASARAAQVRRIATPAKGDQSTADQVGALEVAWPDQRLPPIRLVAKRFRDVWGSYAELAQPASKDEAARLSAAGSPECALR